VSFVLVHGASHGAWCWEPVIPYLERDPRVGRVLALDLVGRADRAAEKPADEIGVADYIEDIVRAVEDADLADVVLVGHSLAGLSIPHAAARLGPRMRRLVCLASAHPTPGTSVMELMQHPLSPVSRGLDLEQMFCNDLDAEATAWLLERLCDEPPGPMTEPAARVELPAGLPATYVLLEQDATLPPELQLEQARNAGIDEVVRFDSGHSAFAARPEALAQLFLGWA